MPKGKIEEARLLRELLETAEDLSSYGVVSKTDMTLMKALCKNIPPKKFSAKKTASGA